MPRSFARALRGSQARQTVPGLPRPARELKQNTSGSLASQNASLADDGVESAMEPTELSTGSHIAFVKDVDGNWVELVEA